MSDSDGPSKFVPPLNCPIPIPTVDRILLAHGEGGRLTRSLIRNELLASFNNEFLRPLADAALLSSLDRQPVMTTDSYVVSPLFFPGGDIGKLAVHGTINDLAVLGAEPLYLSLAFILEEGLPLNVFRSVVESINNATRACGVQIVAGDTKVVPRGAADRMFVSTTGLGQLRPDADLGTHHIKPGDEVLVSGTVGDHGIAILAARNNLELGTTLESDTAPLHDLIASLLQSGVRVRFFRDPTRGGVSAVLHEVAESTGLSCIIDERSVPLSDSVRGACELLGLDPLYIANEGKLLAVVAPEDADHALNVFRQHPLGSRAARIGEVSSITPSQVLIRGPLGAIRVLDEPTGAPLPRIC